MCRLLPVKKKKDNERPRKIGGAGSCSKQTRSSTRAFYFHTPLNCPHVCLSLQIRYETRFFPFFTLTRWTTSETAALHVTLIPHLCIYVHPQLKPTNVFLIFSYEEVKFEKFYFVTRNLCATGQSNFLARIS